MGAETQIYPMVKGALEEAGIPVVQGSQVAHAFPFVQLRFAGMEVLDGALRTDSIHLAAIIYCCEATEDDKTQEIIDATLQVVEAITSVNVYVTGDIPPALVRTPDGGDAVGISYWTTQMVMGE